MVTDPRKRRGRLFTPTATPTAALAATIAGTQSFSATGEWAADAPVTVTARVGVARGAPNSKTIRRVPQLLDTDGLDTVLPAWMRLRATTARTVGDPDLTDTVLSLLRLTGHTNIAAACRWHARDVNRPAELQLTC